MLRSMLPEPYPAAHWAVGDDLSGRDALAVLAAGAPSPEQDRQLTTARMVAVLRRAGRQRNRQAATELIGCRVAFGAARGRCGARLRGRLRRRWSR